MTFLLILFILFLGLAFLAAALASTRNQSAGLWFFLTLIFPFAVLFIATKDVHPDFKKGIEVKKKVIADSDVKNLTSPPKDSAETIVMSAISFILLASFILLYVLISSQQPIKSDYDYCINSGSPKDFCERTYSRKPR
jgi:hypothetical protein